METESNLGTTPHKVPPDGGDGCSQKNETIENERNEKEEKGCKPKTPKKDNVYQKIPSIVSGQASGVDSSHITHIKMS